MKLTPLGKNIIFTFLEETSAGGFLPNAGGKIILTKQNMDHNRTPKWGKVHLVGPAVDPEIKVGEYILVEPMMWTLGFEFEGAKYWKTDSMKVLMTSEVPVNSF